MSGQGVLVTGGAGYIGSHAVLALRDGGHRVVVLDNLSTGHREAVPPGIDLIEGNVAERALVMSVIHDHAIDTVMHFAGSVVVSESVADPLKYYENNTCGSQALLRSCVDAGAMQFIFSSTAAVYGVGGSSLVAEDIVPCPDNPYGKSKLMTEWMLLDLAAAFPEFRYVALRYFNVAGADPKGRAGQRTPNATHLIKVACEAALGLRDHVDIYGDDYDTPDGTGVRDYIHVSDLVDAHLLALDHIRGGGGSLILNCGYGRGYSVREVLAAVERQAGRPFPARNAPRRPGDAASLVANPQRIHQTLAWKPRHADLDSIVRDAFEWERKWRSSQSG